MRNLILSILSVMFLGSLSAQTDTITNPDFVWYQTDTKAWVYTLDTTSVTDEDTLFVDGDTILAVNDTIVIDFPGNRGTAFAGALILNTHLIDSYDTLSGFYYYLPNFWHTWSFKFYEDVHLILYFPIKTDSIIS